MHEAKRRPVQMEVNVGVTREIGEYLMHGHDDGVKIDPPNEALKSVRIPIGFHRHGVTSHDTRTTFCELGRLKCVEIPTKRGRKFL